MPETPTFTAKDIESRALAAMARTTYKRAGLDLNTKPGVLGRIFKAAGHVIGGGLPVEAVTLMQRGGVPGRAAADAGAAHFKPNNWKQPGISDRLKSASEYAMWGDPRAFFPPGCPLLPQAPEDAKPRQLDYPFYYNVQIQPRAYEQISFQFLRDLADSYDLMRLVIETQKNKMCNTDWDIIPSNPDLRTSSKNPTGKIPSQVRAHMDELKKFFKRPDNEHTFTKWFRMLLEDFFVVDAAALYVERRNDGKPHALVPIDGATLSRKIDYHGRTPQPPETAYQQILKGLPALDFTTQDVVYMPMNVRTNHVYGYSPVEQVIITVSIAFSRQQYQLNYYTEGARGEYVLETPDTWTTEQLRQLEEYWNSKMAGNLRNRWRMEALPGGVRPMTPNKIELKDEMDDWLARCICFSMGADPTLLMKQLNRAGGQQQQEESEREGQVPFLSFFEDEFNLLIHDFWGYDDVEFAWHYGSHPNPLAQAQIDQIYLNLGVVTPDEVRDKLALPPKGLDELIATKQALTASQPTVASSDEEFGGKQPGMADDPANPKSPKPPTGSKKKPVTKAFSKETAPAAKPEVKVARLTVIIETPQDGRRTGVGKDGQPWSCVMPVDYGYFKNTEGYDGDEVDVFLAPEPRDTSKIIVVNQADADTGAFDEHKVLFGFPDRDSAYAAYDGSFSDGRGPERRRTAVTMDLGEFKAWLRSKKPSTEVAKLLAGERIEKIAAGRKNILRVAPIARVNPKYQGQVLALKNILYRAFKEKAPRVAAAVLAAIEKHSQHFQHPVRKADWGDSLEGADRQAIVQAVARALDEIMQQGWSVYWQSIAPLMRAGAQTSAITTMTEAGLEAEWENVAPAVISLANERAAELVGMRWNPQTGELTADPNSQWSITDDLRDEIKGLVGQAMQEGWTPRQLGSQIEESSNFSEARAATVARTEMARISRMGGRKAAEYGQLTEKRLLNSNAPDVCDDCKEAADAGWIPIDEDFPGVEGDESELHPNCRCDCIYRKGGQEEEDDESD